MPFSKYSTFFLVFKDFYVCILIKVSLSREQVVFFGIFLNRVLAAVLCYLAKGADFKERINLLSFFVGFSHWSKALFTN